MVNCPLEDGMLQTFGLEPGEFIVVHDDEIDPITMRPRRD